MVMSSARRRPGGLRCAKRSHAQPQRFQKKRLLTTLWMPSLRIASPKSINNPRQRTVRRIYRDLRLYLLIRNLCVFALLREIFWRLGVGLLILMPLADQTGSMASDARGQMVCGTSGPAGCLI